MALIPQQAAPQRATPIDSILAEFSSRWERGETPSIEEYLALLGPAPTSDAAVLIYHAYCLAEATGLNPDPADFNLQNRCTWVPVGRLNLHCTQHFGDAVISISKGDTTAGNSKLRS